MRTRKKIQNQVKENMGNMNLWNVIEIELLLDIRTLVSHQARKHSTGKALEDAILISTESNERVKK